MNYKLKNIAKNVREWGQATHLIDINVISSGTSFRFKVKHLDRQQVQRNFIKCETRYGAQ